jgi:hypothetical protein
MCAAPGGKSLFAWRAMQPELLMCNEVIGKRIGMLFSNLKRCHINRAGVLSKDSSVLAELIPNSSDLVIVDALVQVNLYLQKVEKHQDVFTQLLLTKVRIDKKILANSAHLVTPRAIWLI